MRAYVRMDPQKPPPRTALLALKRRMDHLMRGRVEDSYWLLLGRSWSFLGALGRSCGALGRSWVGLGCWAGLGRSWGALGRSWGALGRSWRDLGAPKSIFQRSWLQTSNFQKTLKNNRKNNDF